MVKRIQPEVTSVACAMEVTILKMNTTRSRLWKVLNDQTASKLFTTGNGMLGKVFEYKMIEITSTGYIFKNST